MVSEEMIPITHHVPAAWETRTLSDVCSKITDGTHKTPKYQPSGVRFISIKNIRPYKPIDWDSYEKFISREEHEQLTKRCDPELGDILFPRIGTLGFAKRIDFTVEVSLFVGLGLLKPKRGVVDSGFLEHWMNTSFIARLSRERATGSGRLTLALEKTRQFPIPLPPLAEQKRIVQILDEEFAAIAAATTNAEKNLANARELFESFLAQRLMSLAESEPTQTLACITDFIIDCEHKTAPTQDTGLPSIRTPNIGKGHLILDGVNRVSEETYQIWTKRAEPKPGDLILAREAPAGNVGIIPSGERVCLGQRTVLLRSRREVVDPQFLAFLLLHPIMQRRLLSRLAGATVEHVNMKDIRALAMSKLPAIDTQQVTVNELLTVQNQGNELESICQRKLAFLTELKQSILQKAFTGELTADKVDMEVVA